MALVRAFRRRRVLAVSAGLLCAVVAATVAWYLIPPAQYVSRTTLMITTYLPKIIFDTAEARADFHTYQRTQVALIKSRLILGAALQDPKVAALLTVRKQEDQVEWLEKALKVEFSANSEILELSLSGDRPTDLASLLNAVTETYMRLIVEEEHRARLARLDGLRKLWNQYQGALRTKRKSVRDLASATGATDRASLALKQKFALENVSIAQQAQMALRPEMLKAESDLKYLEAREEERFVAPGFVAADVPADGLAPLPGNDDPETQALKTQIAKLASRLAANQRLTRNPSDPSVLAPKRGLLAAQKMLAARQAQLAAAPAPTQGRGAGSIAQAKERLQILRLYEDALKKDIERFQQEAQSINLSTLDLQTEQDEIALADATAKKIGSEVEALDVELQAPPRIKVIDRAKVPRTKDEMKKVKMTGIAGVGAFALTVLGVSFWEFRSRRISSADEVVHGLRLRLVGTLPAQLKQTTRQVSFDIQERGDQAQSRLIESIDATRTMLLHVSRAESIRIVMITSALKGEGKTTLAGHLSTSLARAGRRTLLVDCDFRRPAIHCLFDVTTEPGLCELLRGEADLVEVIQPSPSNNLNVITAGRCDALALQALARDGVRPVFDRLAQEYDFLIIDSAPVLQVADSLLLGQQVDAVIFSILRNVSCVPQVQAAYERLELLGVRMLGAVVNGAQDDVYSYHSYGNYSANG